MATNLQLINLAIRHQVYLERVKTSLVREFLPVFDDSDEALRTALRALDVDVLSELTPRELEAFIDSVTEDQLALFNSASDHWINQLPELAIYEAKHQVKIIKGIAAPTTRAKVKAPSAVSVADETLKRPVQAFGKKVEGVATSWANGTADRIAGVIRNGHAQGKTPKQVLAELVGTKAGRFQDGLSAMNRRTAATLVRTGTQSSTSIARQLAFEANPKLILGYEWISVLDNRTSKQCRSLDGKKFKTGEGPLPPLHPNCRSSTTPDLSNGFQPNERGTGTPLDARVGTDTTYYQWLKTQEPEFQDDVLGPTRGQLFRDGGLSAKRFADLQLDQNFEPMTLEEMKELEPKAFKRAEIRL